MGLTESFYFICDNTRLLHILLFPTRNSIVIEDCSALIAVFRIALLRSIHKNATHQLCVTTLLLANKYGWAHAVFGSGFLDGAVLLPGTVDNSNTRILTSEMRSFILKQICNKMCLWILFWSANYRHLAWSFLLAELLSSALTKCIKNCDFIFLASLLAKEI